MGEKETRIVEGRVGDHVRIIQKQTALTEATYCELI